MFRPFVFTFLLSMCFFYFFTLNTFPVYVANYSEYAFGIRALGDTGVARRIVVPLEPSYDATVKNYVRTATVSLFNAEIKLTEVLKGIESIVDVEEKGDNLNSCILSQIASDLNCATLYLKSATESYTMLCNYTYPGYYSHPVNPEMVFILKNFPYQTFFYSQYQWPSGLDTPMSMRVQEVLSDGNVYNVYYTLLSQSTGLLTRLEEVKSILGYGYPVAVIKENFKNNKDSILHKLWDAHYLELRIFLFGQYVSEIFYYIKNNYDLCLRGEWHF